MSGRRTAGLLPWIAAERAIRALILVAAGIVLVADSNHNWGETIVSVARHLGLDPSDNGIRRLAAAATALSSEQLTAYGIVAIGYGGLEGTEAYGLFRRRRWAEYLTVVATSLLFIPEVWELVSKPSLLKVGGLAANAVIVAYLIFRLRRHEDR